MLRVLRSLARRGMTHISTRSLAPPALWVQGSPDEIHDYRDLSESVWLSTLALAGMGAIDMINVTIRQTIVQGRRTRCAAGSPPPTASSSASRTKPANFAPERWRRSSARSRPSSSAASARSSPLRCGRDAGPASRPMRRRRRSDARIDRAPRDYADAAPPSVTSESLAIRGPGLKLLRNEAEEVKPEGWAALKSALGKSKVLYWSVTTDDGGYKDSVAIWGDFEANDRDFVTEPRPGDHVVGLAG